MKGRKRTNTEQKWIKGENPGISKKKKTPTEVDGFLRVIKIRRTTSFGGDLWHVKESYGS
jgi:hypothetical protein